MAQNVSIKRNVLEFKKRRQIQKHEKQPKAYLNFIDGEPPEMNHLVFVGVQQRRDKMLLFHY